MNSNKLSQTCQCEGRVQVWNLKKATRHFTDDAALSLCDSRRPAAGK